jgi:hypothetical protein
MIRPYASRPLARTSTKVHPVLPIASPGDTLIVFFFIWPFVHSNTSNAPCSPPMDAR